MNLKVSSGTRGRRRNGFGDFCVLRVLWGVFVPPQEIQKIMPLKKSWRHPWLNLQAFSVFSQQNFSDIWVEQYIQISSPQSRFQKRFSCTESSAIFCRGLWLHEADVGITVNVGQGIAKFVHWLLYEGTENTFVVLWFNVYILDFVCLIFISTINQSL